MATDYQKRPPQKIAVLPFVDEGKGNYLINKVPVKTRDKEERDRWSWTHADRVWRALAGRMRWVNADGGNSTLKGETIQWQ